MQVPQPVVGERRPRPTEPPPAGGGGGGGNKGGHENGDGDKGDQPGWGNGDRNHDHSGPKSHGG